MLMAVTNLKIDTHGTAKEFNSLQELIDYCNKSYCLKGTEGTEE